jgi:signal transduction histidine kinase
VQLSKQLQESAVLAERHRLARDLHDAVSQALFAATALAESVPQMWEKKPERARELLTQVTSLNRGALAEMRTLLFELRPEALIKTNLKALLIQLLEAIKARKTIETVLTVTGDPITLLEDGHLTFYRIAQESLNNVVKHSQASQVHVILNYTPQQVTLQVIDNGQGFDVTQNTGGLGLGGMHERAEAAHINLQILSTPGEGACIELNWIVSP